jgi:ABC-2 type transport system ATP-binding protein
MVDSLSRGMKQRLCLARTLAHDPQVLILDEPASGLDPRARVEIRELLKELSRLGKTIFFSTHILSDVNEICSHVGIVEAGKLVTQGTLEDIQRQLAPHRRLQITLLEAARLDEAHQMLLGYPGASEVRRPEAPAGGNGGAGPAPLLEVDFSGDDAAVSALLTDLVRRGLPVLSFSEAPHDVEEMFMQITKGIVS